MDTDIIYRDKKDRGKGRSEVGGKQENCLGLVQAEMTVSNSSGNTIEATQRGG